MSMDKTSDNIIHSFKEVTQRMCQAELRSVCFVGVVVPKQDVCRGYNAKVYLPSMTLIQGLSTEYMMPSLAT